MNTRDLLLSESKRVGTVVEHLTLKVGDQEILAQLTLPALKVRNKAFKLSQEGDFLTTQALCVSECLRDENGDRIFSEADITALKDLACGSWFDVVADKAIELVLPKSEQGNSSGS